MRRAWWERVLRLVHEDGAGQVVVPVVGVALALVVGALFLALTGHDPLAAYAGIARGALGIGNEWRLGDPLAEMMSHPNRLGNTLTEVSRLALAGLAVALPLQAGLFNIGGMGQMVMGGIAATVLGLSFGVDNSVPGAAQVAVVLAAGFAGGSLWGAVAGALRAYRGMSEIITTIMLNFIAFWWNSYLVQGALREPESFGFDWSPELPVSAQLPLLVDGTRINIGILVGLAGALAVYFMVWRTTAGFAWRTTGANPDAARFAGIGVKSAVITTMTLAGGLAGLAGALIVAGSDEARLTLTFTQSYGFDGIPLAFIGQAHPLGVMLAGLFFGALRYGSDTVETFQGVPSSISEIILGLTMVFVVASQSLAVRRWLRKKPIEEEQDISPPGPLSIA